MISFERKIFNQYKKSLLYKIFVVYIIFGLLIFSVNRGEYAYFDLLPLDSEESNADKIIQLIIPFL